MIVVLYLNLGVRFALELCAITALSYWGLHTGQGWLGRLALAVGVPLLAVVLWGTFVAPNAAVPVPGLARLALEIAVFGAAAAALHAVHQSNIAGVLAAAFIINRALMTMWGQ